MCHDFQFYVSRADNTHFLAFYAVKHSYCLKAMQKRLQMSAKYINSGQEMKLYKESKFKKGK